MDEERMIMHIPKQIQKIKGKIHVCPECHTEIEFKPYVVSGRQGRSHKTGDSGTCSKCKLQFIILPDDAGKSITSYYRYVD